MNLKNLEGKTPAQQKDLYEIELIADYEIKYGDESNWTEEQVSDFDREWDKIQEKFDTAIPLGTKKILENKE